MLGKLGAGEEIAAVQAELAGLRELLQAREAAEKAREGDKDAGV